MVALVVGVDCRPADVPPADHDGSTDRGADRVKGVRLIEGAIVVVALAVLAVGLWGGTDVEAHLRGVAPGLYGLSFVAVLAWLVASAGTLFVLLRAQSVGLHWPRFAVVFAGGMGLRGLVPGGFVSGPPVMAYVVTTSTPVESEPSLAMAFVAEVCYWLGSVTVAATGLLGIVLFDRSTRVPASLVGGLAVATVVFAGALLLGVKNPRLVERPVHWVAFVGRRTVGRFSARVRRALAPSALDRRIERFFHALLLLGEDPRHLLPALGWAVVGWFCHTVALYVTVEALGLSISPFVAFFVVPVGGVVEGLSLFPGGLGSVESGQTLLLVLLSDMGLGMAGVVVLLFRVSSYWFRLLVGAVCLLYLGINEPDLSERVALEQR